MGAGRPSKYEDIDLSSVEKLAVKGWIDTEMADFFDVDVRTWHRWKIEHDEFCHSLKEWKGESDERVERSLFERALGYSCNETKIVTYEGAVTDQVDVIKHFPPDTTAAIFWLKNRRPTDWRDKQEHELSMDKNKPLKWTVEIVRPKDIDAEDTTT